MNKKQLIHAVAEMTGLTKTKAKIVVDVVVDSLSTKLANGEEIMLAGFGKFSVTPVPERSGRNPQTGNKLVIAARNKPVFKAGKGLKEAVN
ncbi:HU family DNA-binding protein [Pseudomonas plecoglossicida]|uniref:HU family DNA-binding protein n=1 Tax=Pseudomonas plecoglossicida TaxID=70775 RepID=UPI00048D2743|nr:HU family DNA-binding protein [Pseudomonas plecoglossicida]GLR39191.1 transcriptional regulator [Pseudomonas plecoglossicida]